MSPLDLKKIDDLLQKRLKNFPTKDNLKNLATKDDLKNLVTKAEIKELSLKIDNLEVDLFETFSKNYDKLEARVDKLEGELQAP